MKKIIILDRDGIINHDSYDYIKSAEEWHAIPGSLEAVAMLNRAGFYVIIATNQSGVGRGYYTVETLDLIHEKMQSELASFGGHIEDIFFCPHLPTEDCECRKPKPGLLLQIQKKYAVDLATVFFIGDKLTDVEAARAAGCKPLLVLSPLEKARTETHPELLDVPRFQTLEDAVNYVIHADKITKANL
ncbi:MAG TPA: D-glycero-beta-D-manno-heptose 1,7-bisphosphate 7-phosphatase [Gammaproteobacteria bacterium]|nr:D-glycero-beta-D-manno-heptose 1,7-bisphosphate 7-phosphatase [Gammaproteobacteria bacterium]